MAIYLNSYRPLVARAAGRVAIHTYGLPPFIDGSCRREPDFQSPFPSISALCRFDKFAPRLQEDDYVVYVSVKKKYLGASEAHWRLVAMLQVLKQFRSHKDAGSWYLEQGLGLPSNCIVEGNEPIPLSQTVATHDSVEEWDRIYRFRARKCPVFLACHAVHLELYRPPVITADTMLSIFGRFPGTQNPPSISEKQYHRLNQLFLAERRYE
jgi:hypothetical protein